MRPPRLPPERPLRRLPERVRIRRIRIERQRLERERLERYSKTYSDWQEKVYAAVFYKVIDKILVANYEIHICKERPTGKSRRKVVKHLKYLFGAIHAGETEKENPTISFRSRRGSKYVKAADKKCGLARDGKLQIDEKAVNLDWLMKLLEKR